MRPLLLAGCLLLPVGQGVAGGPEKTKKTADLAGRWLGYLSAKGEYTLYLCKLTRSEKGEWSGVLERCSAKNRVTSFPLDSVTLKDGTLRLEVKGLEAVFEGKWDEAAAELKGTWSTAKGKEPLFFVRYERARPQEPRGPFPYDAHEVVYRNKKADIPLGGTLTTPRGKGPFPAVLLITGSGQQDRDSTMYFHKPFLVIADYLSRRGIAVLRVDDRGLGGSGDLVGIEKCTTADFVGDVQSGIDFLKSRADIDGKRIGLMGHSEGAIIAAWLAASTEDVAFVVMLAGPGLTGAETIHLQRDAIMRKKGAPEAIVQAEHKWWEAVYDLLQTDADQDKAAAGVRRLFLDKLGKASEEEKAAALKLFEPQLKGIVSPWLRFYLSYDPRPSLRKASCPILALIGGNDLQVLPTENLEEIRKAFAAGRHAEQTAKLLPKLNHMFQTCTTGLFEEYGLLEESFAPSALEPIGEWIAARTKAAGK